MCTRLSVGRHFQVEDYRRKLVCTFCIQDSLMMYVVGSFLSVVKLFEHMVNMCLLNFRKLPNFLSGFITLYFYQ